MKTPRPSPHSEMHEGPEAFERFQRERRSVVGDAVALKCANRCLKAAFKENVLPALTARKMSIISVEQTMTLMVEEVCVEVNRMAAYQLLVCLVKDRIVERKKDLEEGKLLGEYYPRRAPSQL